MKINNFKFNEEGLNRFFGPLESKIMEIIWRSKECTIKEVQQTLEEEKPTNFNTVMTVMNRLVEKGLLEKKSKGRVSVYKFVISREDFVEKQTKEMTQELMKEFGNLVVSHMIDSLEDIDPVLLEKLENKVNEWKKGN